MTMPKGLADGPIYLDHNATTPVDPRVVEAMLPYLTAAFGNPSSDHHYATAPRTALDRARRQVAELLGAREGRPLLCRVGGDAGDVQAAGAVFEEDQCVQAFAEHGVEVKESAAMTPWAWAVRNSRQVGPVRRGTGSMPAWCRIRQTVEWAMWWPSRAGSPWIRR
jgi:cysteine desulfurase